MATQEQIPSDQLRPGDLVDVEYEIVSDNQTLVGLAVKKIKDELWADPRFDYQGSRDYESSENETGTPQRFLVVTVSVRKYLRGARAGTQEAAIGTIAVATLIALVAAAVIAYSAAVTYRSYTITKIAMDPNIDPGTKKEILGNGTGGGLLAGSIGTLVFAGLIMWALAWYSGRTSGGRRSSYD